MDQRCSTCCDTNPEAFSSPRALRCRACRKRYYAENRDRLLAYQGDYAKRNRRKIAAAWRRRWKTDPEFRARGIAAAQEWYYAHREQVIAQHKARYHADAEYRERVLAYQRARRKRLRKRRA